MGMSDIHYQRCLQTFVYWPKEDPPTAVALARAGFRYLNNGDKVQCDTCKVRLHNWRLGDDPFTEHKKYSPNCSFLAKLEEDENMSSDSEDQKLEKEGGAYMSANGNWVQNQLERPIVKIVLDKFDLDLIREAISVRYQKTKQQFPDAAQLFKAVYKLREEKEKEEEESNKRRQSHLASDSCGKGETDLSSCVICDDDQRGAVFVPCGHLATCTGCATRVTDCPLCRQVIQMRVRVYIA